MTQGKESMYQSFHQPFCSRYQKQLFSQKAAGGGERRREVVRPWYLSQGPAGRQAGRNRAEVIKGRTRDVCAPLGHTSPSPYLLGIDKIDVDR